MGLKPLLSGLRLLCVCKRGVVLRIRSRFPSHFVLTHRCLALVAPRWTGALVALLRCAMRFNPGEHYLLQELFSPFGPISRIYIAYDRETGEARGFAFVNFMYKCAREYQLPI